MDKPERPDKKDQDKLTLNEEVLEKIEHDIDTLRIQFEQYFMGSRKRMPESERTALQYRLRRMANVPSSNYALKYQLQQLVAKFNSYNQYWNRIILRIESGVLSREKLKAVLASGPTEDDITGKQKEAPATPAGKEDLSTDKLDSVYRQLSEAKQQQNQQMSLSREKLEQTLKKQIAGLKEKYQGKNLEFDVVVEAGQAKLRAKAKK